MPDSRPAPDPVEQLAELQKAFDDLKATVLVRASRMPTGTILGTFLTTAPADTLLLQGQTVNRADYPVLWQWIVDSSLSPSVFGAGNGTTTFVLPDARNRVLVGAGTAAVGALVGSDSVTLATANLPAHTHGAAANHSHSFNTNGSGGNHGLHNSSSTHTLTNGSTGGLYDLPTALDVGNVGHAHNGSTDPDGAHTHTSVGSGTAFDNRQAGLAVNTLIYT